MPLLAQDETREKASKAFHNNELGATNQELRSYAKKLIQQVKSEPEHKFDAYKLGGNMAWYRRARPNSPIRAYHRSLGDDPQRVVEDLKRRFQDLLVSEQLIALPSTNKADTPPADSGTSKSTGSLPPSNPSAGGSSPATAAQGQSNQVPQSSEQHKPANDNTSTYLTIGGAVAGGVLLLMFLNN